MNIGTVTLDPVTYSRQQWRTSAVFSASGPTMLPGVSQRHRMGRSKASQICMKRAALSAPSLSTAPARWIGLLATRPIGRPSMRMRAVIMPGAEFPPELENGAFVRERLDDPPGVVDAKPVLGHDVAQAPLIGAGPVVHRPWKYER